MYCRLVGMDSSSKSSGMSIWEDGILKEYKIVKCDEKDMEHRFNHMSLSLWNELENCKPSVLYMEETVVVRNPQVQRFLTRLQGVVYSWCMLNNCEFNTIRPTQWRKLAGINNSKKKRPELKLEAINLVKEKYKIEANDDVAEAILIGEAALNKFTK